MQSDTTVPLTDRVVEALVQCHRDTREMPTSVNYRKWRSSLPSERRGTVPSMTAVVPLAFPSWAEARMAAGFDDLVPLDSVSPRGPKPMWTEEECIDWVRQWRQQTERTSLSSFSTWLDEQRADGAPAPSASTVRLRLRLPWSSIVRISEEPDGEV